MIEQPSEAQEAANAAYTWRKHVQGELVDELRKISITLESAEYWFERFRRAYQREIDTGEAAKRKPPSGGSDNG